MRNRLMIKDRASSSSSLTSTSSSSSSAPQLPHHPPHTRKPKLALLREVFGRGGFDLLTLNFTNNTNKKPFESFLFSPGSVFCWLLPLHSSPPSVGGISYSALPDYDVWPLTCERRQSRQVSICVWETVWELTSHLLTWKVKKTKEESEVCDEWSVFVCYMNDYLCVLLKTPGSKKFSLSSLRLMRFFLFPIMEEKLRWIPLFTLFLSVLSIFTPVEVGVLWTLKFNSCGRTWYFYLQAADMWCINLIQTFMHNIQEQIEQNFITKFKLI